MSVDVMALVFDCFYLGGGERMLALALADHAHDDGSCIYPSVATLAHKTMQSERTIQRQLARLLGDGWLQAVGDTTGGRGRTVVYCVSPQWLDDAALEKAEARSTRRKLKAVQPVKACVPAVAESDDVGGGADGGGKIKGDKLTPFMPQKPCGQVLLKGDKNDVKGDKNSLKGDTAMSPEPMNTRTNTPLPPKRGESGIESENPKPVATQKANTPPNPDPKPDSKKSAHAHAAEGLQRLLAAWPRQDAADNVAAVRALVSIRPSPTDLAAMLGQIAVLAQSEPWRRDDGRWVPKLSRWLRGWALQPEPGAMGIGAVHAGGGSAWPSTRSGVESIAAQHGLGTYDAEKLAFYQKSGGQHMSFAAYEKKAKTFCQHAHTATKTVANTEAVAA